MLSQARCHNCRKRQIKCDGGQPTCLRCSKDSIHCRGYDLEYRFVAVDPTTKPRLRRPMYRSAKDARPIAAPPTLTKHISIDDRDLWSLRDCVHYWNSYYLPQHIPADRPFHRYFIDTERYWRHLPKLSIHLTILGLRSAQLLKHSDYPLSQHEICYYRGLSIRGIQGRIREADKDVDGTALISIVMLMLTEMILTEASWLVHYSAVQTIIAMRGGVAQCMRDIPNGRNLFMQFLIADVLTSSVCNAASLQKALNAEAVCDLPDIDGLLVAAAVPCPSRLFRAIAQANSLRQRAHEKGRSRFVTHEKTSEIKDAFDETMEHLSAFDGKAWAERLFHAGQCSPLVAEDVASCESISALSMLAECYRSATLIYLLLSAPVPFHGHDRVFEQVKAAENDLHLAAAQLFEQALIDCNGILPTQLWRFLTWPLVISVYAEIGWNIDHAGGGVRKIGESAEKDIERLRQIADVKGTRHGEAAAAHMRRVQAARARNLHQGWTWDMGFPTRCSFVL